MVTRTESIGGRNQQNLFLHLQSPILQHVPGLHVCLQHFLPPFFLGRHSQKWLDTHRQVFLWQCVRGPQSSFWQQLGVTPSGYQCRIIGTERKIRMLEIAIKQEISFGVTSIALMLTSSWILPDWHSLMLKTSARITSKMKDFIWKYLELNSIDGKRLKFH